MTNLASEKLLSLNEVRDLFPRGRCGKKISLPTLYRWMNSGHFGVRLEYIQLPDRRLTSKEAVFRFLGEVTERSKAGDRSSTPTASHAARRRREIAAAEVEADRLLKSR